MEQNTFNCPEGWSMYHTVLYRRYKNPKPSRHLAIFDLDNTLIITPSYYVEDLIRGVNLPISKPVIPKDFVLIAPNVRNKFLQEIKNGREILVLSNQRGILANLSLAYVILDRIELVLKEINVPLHILLATEHDIYRKPAPGMLKFFEKNLNDGLEVDPSRSFFVGDAAGRTLPYKKSVIMLEKIMTMIKSKDFSRLKYYNYGVNRNLFYIDAASIIRNLDIKGMKNRCAHDFSDCDYKFALNTGLQFYTPDEYFYDIKPYNLTLDFIPKKIGSDPFFPSVPEGLMVLIGNISTGKTYITKYVATDFTKISEYESSNDERLYEILRDKLSKTRKVIVDATNHLTEHRMRMVKIASELGLDVFYVYLALSHDLICHLNKIRRLSCEESTHEYFKIHQSDGKYYSGDILTVLKMQKPILDEGVKRIYTITDRSFPMQHTELSMLHLP